jgi:Fe-S-cluster containining protein
MNESTKRKNVSLPVAKTGADPWYADGLHFECTQCGNCCSGGPGYVWLTQTDMEKIAAFLNLPFDTFTRTYVRRIKGAFSLTEKFNYDCTFLRRENGKAICGIYPVRPMQCRTWPFWNDNLDSRQHWTNAAGRCPGMRDAKGPKYELHHIEKCRTHPESP